MEWIEPEVGPDCPEYYLGEDVEGSSYLDDEYDREADYWFWSGRGE